MVLTIVSVSMGKTIKEDKVNKYIKFVCVVLCFFGALLLAAAYFKLFQNEVGLTSIVTVIYLASYVVPPILYDFRNFWGSLGD
jgi:magnesium-transporting ATPase (P-type)